MDFMQDIVLQDELDDITLDNFVDILYKPDSQISSGKPQMPCCSSALSTSKLVFTPSTPMSPVRAFVSSPQEKQKILARERHEDLRKVESQLATERALRLDQESEIAEKNGNIKNQNKQLETLQHEVQKLKKQMEINKRMETRLADLDHMKKEMHNLQGVIDRVTEENAKLRSQILARKRHEDFRKVESQLATEKALRLDQESEIAEKNGVIENQNKQLKILQHEVQQLKKQVTQTEAGKDAEIQKKMEINKRMETRLADLDHMKKEMHNLQGVIDRVMEENAKLRSQMNNFDYLKRSSKTMEGELRETEGEVFNLDTCLQQYKERLQSEQQRNEILKNNYEEMQAIYNSKMEEFREKVMNQSGDECNMKSGESLASEMKHFELEEEIQRLQNNIESITAEKEQIKQSASHMEVRQMVAHQNAIKDIEQEAERMKDEMTRKLTESQNKVQELNDMVEKRTEQIENLMNEHNNKILKLNEEEQALKDTLNSQTQLKEKMIQDQEDLRDKFENEKRSLQKSLQTKEVAISDMNSCLEQLEAEKKHFEMQSEVMFKQLSQKQSEFSAMEEQKRVEINQLIMDHKNIITTLEMKITQVKTEKSELEKQMEVMSIQLVEKQSEMSAVEEQKQVEINKFVISHQVKNTELETELGRVRCEYEKSQQEMKDLEDRKKQQVDQVILKHQNKVAQMAQSWQNNFAKVEGEKDKLKDELKQLTEELKVRTSEIELLKVENIKYLGKRNAKLEQYQAKCNDLEEKTQQQARQLESNALEVKKLHKNANEWITKKDKEISRSAENSEKMMAAVKEREHVIRDMKEKLHRKDEEFIRGMKDRDRLKEENVAMERQLEEHRQTFEQEMKAIEEKQEANSGLEAKIQKLSKDKGAVEAKFQRLLASQDKRKKELVQMKNEALTKAEGLRQENEKMRIDIRTLETKLHQAEEEVCVAKTSNFENFSGVEFVQSMDSINDSLEDELSLDDVNISKASSDRSASGFSLSLPRRHRLNKTVNKYEKKQCSSKCRKNTSSTPSNLTPTTLCNESFMGSLDSLTSFQQPLFSSLRSSRKASLRSGRKKSQRESILPVKVDNTIDELAQSRPNFLRSSLRQQSMLSSRQATAWSGFVVVNDCDDEPVLEIDWNRLSECQRRKTLCSPSYPVEVQVPTDLSENETQKGLESSGVLTRAQKRRGTEPVTSTAIKSRTGNQREHLPPPDAIMLPPPVPLQEVRRKATRPIETIKPGHSAETFVPSTNFAPEPTAVQEVDRRESIAFNVRFSPKQPKRCGRRPLVSKNSTEWKKAATLKKSRAPKRKGTPKRGTPKREGTPKRGNPPRECQRRKRMMVK